MQTVHVSFSLSIVLSFFPCKPWCIQIWNYTNGPVSSDPLYVFMYAASELGDPHYLLQVYSRPVPILNSHSQFSFSVLFSFLFSYMFGVFLLISLHFLSLLFTVIRLSYACRWYTSLPLFLSFSLSLFLSLFLSLTLSLSLSLSFYRFISLFTLYCG